jgi:hypothetical protein
MMRGEKIGSSCKQIAISPAHDVNRKNTALMARQQIIDKIAND